MKKKQPETFYYQEVLANGKIITRMEVPEKSEQNKIEDNKWLDDLLSSQVVTANIKLEIRNSIKNNDYPKFLIELNSYLEKIITSDNKKDIETFNYNKRKWTIDLFLDELEDKRNEYVKEWIVFLTKGDLVNPSNIALSLWLTQCVAETESYVSKNMVSISKKHYDNFFDIFRSHINRNDAPYSQSEKDLYMKKEQEHFFGHIMKIALNTKLNKELINDIPSSRRFKI